MSAPMLRNAKPDEAELRALKAEIEDFNWDYADALDNNRLAEWPNFFAEDAFYRIRSRENAEAGMPVGLVHCEGRPMIVDRAFALQHTEMFEPRYYRHVIGTAKVFEVSNSGVISARANYALYETIIDEDTRLLQAGQYVDEFVRVGGRLLLRRRECIYDSSIVHTALIYPV
jgi:3-phenylpropionate/cinnamic acid dioxygenase small subunit